MTIGVRTGTPVSVRHNKQCVLVALSLALLLSSCKEGVWTGDQQDTSVAVFGDSLVYSSEADDFNAPNTYVTDDLVALGSYAYVTAWIGASVAYSYANLWNLPSRNGVVPDVLVLALGTNDMRVNPVTGLPYATVEDARLVLQAWLAEVPDACVRLVGVAESITTWGLDVTGPGWNAMLSEEAALFGNAAYVPWEPLAAWTANGTSPHLAEDGEDAYRALIVSAAAGCLSSAS
ncbi:MAG: lysophospholipase L1-like esterase [Candidatus Aldehydirespiratoraceae bacterium]|jgi:lysophospholipase L1-like esterase